MTVTDIAERCGSAESYAARFGYALSMLDGLLHGDGRIQRQLFDEWKSSQEHKS